MANEATLRYANSDGSGNILQDYTVSGAVAITKGAILKMTDPRTAVLADGDGDVCAGIAARDKVANDGRTRLSVYRQGDFDVIASGAITIGHPVQTWASTGAANVVAQATAALSGAAVIGYALETAAEGETFQMRLKL